LTNVQVPLEGTLAIQPEYSFLSKLWSSEQCTTKDLKTGQCSVRFRLIFLTGQVAKKPDCPVKNRTPGNPIYGSYCQFDMK